MADGSRQQAKYSKEDIASPTVSNAALMMTLLIDTFKGQSVGTTNAPGAYLHADMDDFTLLKMTGESVDIMCKMNPEYKKFVAEEKGKQVLYLRLLKAHYGCIRSAMLWYKLFVGTLKDMGFKINPYDMCVANKMVNRSNVP